MSLSDQRFLIEDLNLAVHFQKKKKTVPYLAAPMDQNSVHKAQYHNK
jgi:hypothetical protein